MHTLSKYKYLQLLKAIMKPSKTFFHKATSTTTKILVPNKNTRTVFFKVIKRMLKKYFSGSHLIGILFLNENSKVVKIVYKLYITLKTVEIKRNVFIEVRNL